jgi:nucleoside-diphosphate kinase
MALERTLAIVKPDAVASRNVGVVLSRIEKEGFRIVALRMAMLSKEEAEGFYHVHKERPFFADLVAFMTSGPVVLMCLERDGAIAKWREVMGPTDPAKAPNGTLRKQVGTNIERNGTHGSDAPETAAFEVTYFFRGLELR